eukprot:gene5443-9256_t
MTEEVNVKKGPVKMSRRRPAMNKGSVLSELDSVEQQQKQDTLTTVKEDIKSEIIKEEDVKIDDEPKRVQVMPSTTQSYELDEEPAWQKKLKKEKDERVLKWIQTMAPKLKFPDIKDYSNESLNNGPFLLALIRYFEPKVIKEGTEETVEAALEIFKALDIEANDLKTLIFKAHENFTSPVYEGIIRQRNIEARVEASLNKPKKSLAKQKDCMTIMNFDDADEAINALEDNEGEGIDWVLFSYEKNDAKKFIYVAKGFEGLEEARDHLIKDTVNYLIIKTFITRSTGAAQAKVALVTLLNGRVKPLMKAKSGAHSASLIVTLRPVVHIDFEKKSDDVKDLEIDNLFLGQFKDIATSSVKARSKSLMPTSSSNSSSSGNSTPIKFDSGKTSTTSSPKVKSGTIAPSSTTPFLRREAPVSNVRTRRVSGRVSDLSYEDPKELASVFADLGKGKIQWMILSYTDIQNNPYILKVHSKGIGGCDSFKKTFEDPQIYFVITRLDQEESLESTLAKYILVTFVGPKAPPFSKSLSSGHRNVLMEYSRKYVSIGAQFQPHDISELTDDELASKISGTNVNSGKQVEYVPRTVTPFKSRTPNGSPTLGNSGFVRKKAGSFIQIAKSEEEQEFSGKEEIKNKLKELTDDKIQYFQLGISGKKYNEISIISEGTEGALEEDFLKLLPEESVCYFVLKFSFSETGYGMMTKYVFIDWIGSKLKPLAKAKFTGIKPSVSYFINSITKMNLEIQTSSIKDLEKESVLAKITGSRRRGSEMVLAVKQDKYKNLGKDKIELKFENKEKIESLVEKITQEDEKMKWCVMGYKGDSADTIEVKGSGEGLIDEMKNLCKKDNVLFFFFKYRYARSYHKDFDHLHKNYFGFFHWTGKEISLLEKGLSSHHWNSYTKLVTRKLDKLQHSIQGSHYHADDVKDITDERFVSALRLYD